MRGRTLPTTTQNTPVRALGPMNDLILSPFHPPQDSTHYNRTLALLEKYDPDFVPAQPLLLPPGIPVRAP